MPDLIPEEILNRLELERSLWRKGKHCVAGLDEAGRGALAGPVVAAAVVVSENAISLINEVRDSKRIPEAKRELLFDEIHAVADAVGVGIIDPKEIDQINILQASFKAMRVALQKLPQGPDICLIDGNQDPKTGYAQRLIVKGDDRVFSIGAASIIAKVTRDRLMREFDLRFPNYGFCQNKGYGTKQHLEALRAHGLSPLHRRSFRPKSLR